MLFFIITSFSLFVLRCNAVVTCGKYPCLIFKDDFQTFNYATWHHEVNCGGGGNGEFQCYVNNSANSYVKNGVLYIKPTIDDNGNIASARLNTHDSFGFRYGRLQIRAKLPLGDWLWPAIWMMPRNSFYGIWPRSGEIDIMESRGNRHLYAGNDDIGVNQFGSTLHFGTDWQHNGWPTAHNSFNLPNGGLLSDDWHVYVLDWTPSGLKVAIDGRQMFDVDTGSGYWQRANLGLPVDQNPWRNGGYDAPFDKDFYVILNVAIGGTNGFFPDNARNDGNPKPWQNGAGNPKADFVANRNLWYPSWPQGGDEDKRALQIDWVFVWKMSADQNE